MATAVGEVEMPTPPRQFFEAYVLRSFNDFLAAPHDEYLAKTAVGHANVMAERMWKYYETIDAGRVYGTASSSLYRDALAVNECADFGLVRDVAEGFKHYKLTHRKATRRVTKADQTGYEVAEWHNASGATATWRNASGSEASWGAIIVNLDDGSRR